MRTVARDAEQVAALEALGWRVVVLWECDIRRPQELRDCLTDLFSTESERRAV